MRYRTALVLAGCTALWLGTAHAQPCPGDCDGNGDVRVNELVTCVRAALALEPLAACCDANSDGSVTVSDLVASVGASLGGCGGGPTPSVTPATPATPTTPGPTGTPADVRCCLPNPAGDEIECEDRTAEECAAQRGVNKGVGVCELDTCADVPPPNPDLACCVPSGEDYECEDRNAAECFAEGGIPRGIGPCAPDTCDGFLGTEIMCCVPDDDRLRCEDRTPEECAERGGTNMGPGDCEPDPCNF